MIGGLGSPNRTSRAFGFASRAGSGIRQQCGREADLTTLDSGLD